MTPSRFVAKDQDSEEGLSAIHELYGEEGRDEAMRRIAALAEAFSSEDAQKGLRIYSAPGRTELAGNHTDHNHGKVLCAAVQLDVLACVAPRNDGRVTMRSPALPAPLAVDLRDRGPRPEEAGTTAALVRGVAAVLAERGLRHGGFDASVDSTVAVGSGLSSSAAIECLLGVIMSDLAGVSLLPTDIAKIGQRAENEWFGKPCGLMDQMASAHGGIIAIDFRDPASPETTPLYFDFASAGYILHVVHTRGSHADLTGDYAEIPADMRRAAAFFGADTLGNVDPADFVARSAELWRAVGDKPWLRAAHFFAETARVPAMVGALATGDMPSYLALARESGDSSWRLLGNIDPPSQPRNRRIATALAVSERWLKGNGMVRIHGGGFAGTIQALVPVELSDGYRSLMESWFGQGSVQKLRIRPIGATRIL
ncbi:MAG: galactokinase [Rectinemataceae bacterium]